MKTEKFENVTISYRRNVGEYGVKNQELMESFKAFLQSKGLYDDEMILLGIALDDPAIVASEELRYDVGIVSGATGIEGLDHRKIADGVYGIIEVPHTQAGIQEFWRSLGSLANQLAIDFQKPIIERYTLAKINQHLCEFCIPLVTE